MRIYFDNNATTPLHPDVIRVLDDACRNVFGNASSIHKEGQAARRLLEESRESVAHLIGASAREVVFTSGGTESNNAAIFGLLPDNGRHHIVTTAIEHPSVAAAIHALESEGHQVTRVAPQPSGAVEAAAVIAALQPDTRLVTVMLAHNETGVLQPVGEIGRACRERSIHLHCDAVQAAGKIPVRVDELHVDTLAIAAHKMHGPKGIGVLYVRTGTTLDPYLRGGSQERRRRAGTENVPLAAAFGAAARAAADVDHEALRQLRDTFEAHLRRNLKVSVNGSDVPRLPNTSSVVFYGADAEGIVIALDLEGVAASTGSACSSGRIEPSGALLAMGLTPEEARSTVRFSLSRFTTLAEVERVAELLEAIVPRAMREQTAATS